MQKSRTSKTRLKLMIAIVAALIISRSSTRCTAGERLLTTTPSESVLLLDDHTVARTSHLTQRFFPAAKASGESGDASNGAVGRRRAVPVGQSFDAGRNRPACFACGTSLTTTPATSIAGVTPPRRTASRGPSRTSASNATPMRPPRNLLPLGPHPEKGTRSIARDPRPETPAERRYLGVRFTYDGEFVSFSPDGIAWKEHPLSPSWHVPSDIIHVMWDEPRNRFIAYYKLWELAGTEVTAAGEEKPFLAYMPTFTPTKLPDNKESFDGPVIHFKPNAAAEVKNEKFVLRAANQGKDDGGGTSLSGAWTAKRVQAFAESDDGIHWTNEQVVLRADEKDPPTANIQYMFVIPYGGYYVGFLTMHDEAGYFRIQLACSADGIKWHRPSRDAWLDVGPEGSFDCGMVLGPATQSSANEKCGFPTAASRFGTTRRKRIGNRPLGLPTTRLDGFAAWEAADEAGELVTQPFRCNGDRLFVNADAHERLDYGRSARRTWNADRGI